MYSDDDELATYYKEQMDSWMAKQIGHTCYRALLDALLENRYMIESALVAVSGHLNGVANNVCLVVQGSCFGEDAVVVGFRALYVTNPNWQIPTEHPYLLDSIEIDEHDSV